MYFNNKLLLCGALSTLLLTPNFTLNVKAEEYTVDTTIKDNSVTNDTELNEKTDIINSKSIELEANDINSIKTILNNLYNKTFNDEIKVIENTTPNITEYNVGNINVKIENLSLNKLGKQVITVYTQNNIRSASMLLDTNLANQKIVTNNDTNLKEEDLLNSSNIKYVSKIKVNVKDTKTPILEIQENITLEEGDTFDINNYILSSKDEVDGEISERVKFDNIEEFNKNTINIKKNRSLQDTSILGGVSIYNNSMKNNYVAYTGDVDINTIGIYTINLFIVDKNYNIVEKNITVNIVHKKDIVEKNTDFIIDWLNSKVGNPYIWGGNGPIGYDCSGLTQQLYGNIGISIPRVADAQMRVGQSVDLNISNWRVGDMVFYTNSSGYADHVGMYIGNGMMIEAANPTDGIIKVPVHYQLYNEHGVDNLTQVRRIIEY